LEAFMQMKGGLDLNKSSKFRSIVFNKHKSCFRIPLDICM